AFHLALEHASGDAATIDALSGLLKCAFFTQRLDVSLTRGMQALHLAERLGDPGRLSLVHNDLGLLYGVLGDFEGALDHLLAGLRLRREGGEDADGSVLNNIGNVYLELGDDRQALSFFQQALDAFSARGTPRQQ